MIDLDVMQAYIRDANPIPHVDNVDPDELATFVAAAHTRRAAMIRTLTRRPTPNLAGTPVRHRRRRAWAFVVAFLAVVASIGIAALVMRGRDNAPVTDQPAPPVTNTGPSTTAAALSGRLESLAWTRVPHDDAVFDPTPGVDVMKDVVAWGPGFVAVGTTDILDSAETARNAAVWISEDGITWSLLPNDAPPLGGPDKQEVESVAIGGPGLVAVGHEWQMPLGGNAVVWASEDGKAWSRVPHDEAVFGNGGMLDVTAGGPGIVAVGGAQVWTSVDGLTWNRFPLPPEASPYPETDGAMTSVTSGGPGLVAVGFTGRDPEEGCNAAVWTSPDGFTWSRVPHDEAVFGGAVMFDVTAGGPGLVAVGTAGNDAIGGIGTSAAVWTSPDGFTWTRVPHDADAFGGEGLSMNAVTSVGSQLVAVGGYGHDDTGASPTSFAWTSVDGLTWTRVEPDGRGGRMHGAVATGQKVVAVGQVPSAAAVWVAVR